MARNKGTFNFAANFQVKMQEALDPRVAVSTKEALITKETWPYDGDTLYLYEGLSVSVVSEQSIYILTDITKALSTDYSGWVKVNAAEIIDNVTSTSTTAALSANQGKVLMDEISSVKEKITSIYHVKGSVATYATLPTTNEVGDVYNVDEAYEGHPAGTNYVWTGEKWDALGGSIDLSNYYTKEEVETAIKTETDRATKAELDINNLLNTVKDTAEQALTLSNTQDTKINVLETNVSTINDKLDNEVLTKLDDVLKSSIDITYNELVGASTLIKGQTYRIIDYVTTCNGTTTKVTDASTIDTENPVDGQARSAGHLFDIIVTAISNNQLGENAIAVRHEGDTYYSEEFDNTIIKYTVENKQFSAEDGKGTIFYMKDNYNNECPYDFTNIQYYNTNENIETGWYYTFSSGVDSYYNRAHDNLITPTGLYELPNIILITPEITAITIYDNHITLYSYNLLISGLAIMCNNISTCQNTNFIASAPIHANKINGLYDSNFISTSNIICNEIHGSKNLNFHCKEISYNIFDLLSRTITVDNEQGRCFINRFTKNSYNITADSLEGMTFNSAFNITLVAVNNASPKYCNIGVNTGCMNITLTGNIQGSNISGRYLEIVGDSTASINNNIHEVRGASASNPLSITLQSGNNKKDIYSDVSGRIFHVWEDNGVKKGYYLDSNTDTEWKEYTDAAVQDVNIYSGNDYIQVEGEIDDTTIEHTITVLATSDIQNSGESGYLADAYGVKTYVEKVVSEKQETLSSGTNIKTINGESILGSGDLQIGTYITDFSRIDLENLFNEEVSEVSVNATALAQAIKDNKVIAVPEIINDEFTYGNYIAQAIVEDMIYLTFPQGNAYYWVYIDLEATSFTGVEKNIVQNELVSGINIKTINGESVLASGDVAIDADTIIVDGGDTLNTAILDLYSKSLDNYDAVNRKLPLSGGNMDDNTQVSFKYIEEADTFETIISGTGLNSSLNDTTRISIDPLTGILCTEGDNSINITPEQIKINDAALISTDADNYLSVQLSEGIRLDNDIEMGSYSDIYLNGGGCYYKNLEGDQTLITGLSIKDITPEEDSTKTIDMHPNILYNIIGDVVSLLLNLVPIEMTAFLGEYLCQFTTSTDATLAVPETVLWVGGTPTIGPGTYQISILNNIGLIVKL